MTEISKQPNAQMCFVCGLENPVGLKMHFYQDADGRTLAQFTPEKKYEGYPGVVHGGIVTAMLDEVLGRAAIAAGEWTVTVRLNVRFRRPVPIGHRLTVVGEVTGHKRNLLEACGQILLEDGQVAAEATGTFMKMPSENLDQMVDEAGYWKVVPDPAPPTFGAPVCRSEGHHHPNSSG